MIKIDGLEELHRWILNTDNRLRFNQPLMFHPMEVNQVTCLVDKVADSVRSDYPFYSSEMPQIVRPPWCQAPLNFYKRINTHRQIIVYHVE